MSGKYRLTTLGCKVNQYESQQIRETLESLGLRAARRGETPDLGVVNTCAVTVSAARKSRQFIRRVSEQGKVPIVVVGCYAAAAADTLQHMDGVVAVLGHDRDICQELREVASCRLETGADHRHRLGAPGRADAHEPHPAAGRASVGDDVLRSTTDPVQGPPSTRSADCRPATTSSIRIPVGRVNNANPLNRTIRAFAGHQRAFLKVQDGCDARCTYCIIPRLRPRPGWKPIATAVEEARALVGAGHREIVVTGIYLGAYGRSTAVRRPFNDDASPLADLIDALATVEGLTRLRLSSLEPGDVDDRLLSALRRHDCCVPHLHVPLQAGSDAVLRRMNRQYTVGQFFDMIDRVRTELDRPALSTDVVVGFPGETDADFERTLDIVRHAAFCKVHAFPFSPRPGTAAAGWADQFVDSGVVKQRMNRLADVERQTARRFVGSFVGCEERVIVEQSASEASRTAGKPHDSLRHGRTDRYFDVHFAGPDVCAGDVAKVRIDAVTPGGARGTLIKTLCATNCLSDRHRVT
ncbi:MAG: MiaB/RimO family radical SAM methylthiotransferase [Phycisphaerales bacterium]|nr:MAG: MiaB/RimO family radical SAM methylthiotransferase [Phycisphaerales bacterium]